jgi:epoxide hydrolase-like predicted phosphatase
MVVRAVVFDIGGVLEDTPPLGTPGKWEERLGLRPGELDERTDDLWQKGALGLISLADVHAALGERLGVDEAVVTAFMDDMWTEYLGTLNAELTGYLRGLRPRYRTGILSNSFVGAREREQARYGFGDLCDLIIYSHEEGMQKPDLRFYALACERLAVRPEEMIFLDDVEACVVAARDCGIQAIHFVDNAQAIAEIETCLTTVGVS